MFCPKGSSRHLVCSSSLPFVRLAQNTRTNPPVGHPASLPTYFLFASSCGLILALCRIFIYLPHAYSRGASWFMRPPPFRAGKELTEKATEVVNSWNNVFALFLCCVMDSLFL